MGTTVTKRDTERGAGQERVTAAASLYGWTEVDYRALGIPSDERVWTKGDRVFCVRLGESAQVLAAWAYHGAVEDRAALSASSVIGAVTDGRNKAGRAVELLEVGAGLRRGDRVRHVERPRPGTIVLRVAAWTPNDLTTHAPDAGMVQVVWDEESIAHWEYVDQLERA